jgi:hypothetical protein
MNTDSFVSFADKKSAHFLIAIKKTQNNNRRNIMPMVGKKKFSYSKKGKAAAKKYAKKTGKKMKSKY